MGRYDIGEGLGLTPIRQGTLLNLLLAYAQDKPTYIQMIERVYNDPQLSNVDRKFCVFAIGQVSGIVRVMKMANIKLGQIDPNRFPLARLVKIFLEKRSIIV